MRAGALIYISVETMRSPEWPSTNEREEIEMLATGSKADGVRGALLVGSVPLAEFRGSVHVCKRKSRRSSDPHSRRRDRGAHQLDAVAARRVQRGAGVGVGDVRRRLSETAEISAEARRHRGRR